MSQTGASRGPAAQLVLDKPPSHAVRSPRNDRTRMRDLRTQLAAVQKQYTDLHHAISEAGSVYRHLCAPRFVRRMGFEIASEIFAVRHVPGDFFAIEETSNDGVLLALGDVCGKGLSAGMWITHMVGLVGIHAGRSEEPGEIVAGINSDLCRNSAAPMASLFVARLDPASGNLEYSCAGHPPALFLRANGSLEQLSEGGPLLGAIPGGPYVSGKVQLSPGDTLLACSDGILESFNDVDEEFGYSRLEARLRSVRDERAEALLFAVLAAVQDFAASRPLMDDMSLVVVRRDVES
jgi:phosphoserine phosphatase RsbU/P